MLEILLVVSISNKIAANLQAKGRSATGYVILFVFLWFAGEILGFIAGIIVEGDLNLLAYLFALAGAAVGGTIGYVIANSVPPLERERPRRDFDDDKWDDDENDRERERRRRRRSDDDTFEEERRR